MKPIAPGTLCLVISPAPLPARGRCVTVVARLAFDCNCGGRVYQFEPAIGDADACCQAVLKPILPPGVDVNVTQADDVKVPA